MIVVIVRDEDGRELQLLDLLIIESDVRKRMAVPAERILEDGIKRDLSAFAFENVTGVQDSGDLEGHQQTLAVNVREATPRFVQGGPHQRLV